MRSDAELPDPSPCVPRLTPRGARARQLVWRARRGATHSQPTAKYDPLTSSYTDRCVHLWSVSGCSVTHVHRVLRAEALFVGAAKGQASVVVWLAHLVRNFLRRAYAQLRFDEAWLCPSPRPTPDPGRGSAAPSRCAYVGTLFAVSPRKRPASEHVCEAEGCWHFLGQGHKRETMRHIDEQPEPPVCVQCGTEARFALRGGL